MLLNGLAGKIETIDKFIPLLHGFEAENELIEENREFNSSA
jgi:hypothetical protein